MAVSIGIVGAGTISQQYLGNLTQFPDVQVDFIADQVPQRAQQVAEEFGVTGHGTLADLLATDVEVVVNLTIPAAHAEVSEQAIAAGKHVWIEKPIATTVKDATALLQYAADQGVVVAGAPDTFLGAGLQSSLRFIASQEWGTPVAALSMFATPGPQSWHPAPEFLFDRDGGGPLYDIGPYHLTTLVQAFGPVASVVAHGSTAQPTRTIGSGPRAGTVFDVSAYTGVSALVEFRSGGHAQLWFSFESGIRHNRFEIVCEQGTIELPDPNRFDGETVLHSSHGADQVIQPLVGTTFTRGIGIVEMVQAIAAQRPPRASGELMLHVLDVMEAAKRSMENGGNREHLSTSVQPAELLDPIWDPAQATGL